MLLVENREITQNAAEQRHMMRSNKYVVMVTSAKRLTVIQSVVGTRPISGVNTYVAKETSNARKGCYQSAVERIALMPLLSYAVKAMSLKGGV